MSFEIPQSPPNPQPAAPPKKSRPILRIGIGCLSLVVLSCLGIGAFALYQNWQQEQNYNAGHEAYLKGNCADASAPLGKAASGEPGTKDSDVARKAQAELQECEALIAADALGKGKPADAVIAYSAFVTKYPSSPLKDPALTKGQDLTKNTAPADLVSGDVCQSLDALTDQKFITAPDDTLPPLLQACGQSYEEAKMFSEAVAMYDRFRSDYPKHELAPQVEQAFARATVAEARAQGAGELPPPQAVGSGTAGGQVTVVIRNDSPDSLSVVFSGPETRVEELEACADCVKFTGDGPESCPEKGPTGNYVLAPGTYDVVVKSKSGRDVTPFSGSWSLEQGQEYSSCFYLVTSQ